ncbi:unnamed protein product [Camellia sinensis]
MFSLHQKTSSSFERNIMQFEENLARTIEDANLEHDNPSLYSFRSVSKSWLALITSPYFIKSQLDRLPISSSAVSVLQKPCKSGAELVGSCNG